MSRPPKYTDRELDQAAELAHRTSARHAAETTGIGISTILGHIRRQRNRRRDFDAIDAAGGDQRSTGRPDVVEHLAVEAADLARMVEALDYMLDGAGEDDMREYRALRAWLNIRLHQAKDHTTCS